MQVDILQLFSQWAISTGEKGPKNFWGYFFYFHLKLWKVLTPPQLPAKNFSKTSRSKKKNLSFIESNTALATFQQTIRRVWPHYTSFAQQASSSQHSSKTSPASASTHLTTSGCVETILSLYVHHISLRHSCDLFSILTPSLGTWLLQVSPVCGPSWIYPWQPTIWVVPCRKPVYYQMFWNKLEHCAVNHNNGESLSYNIDI